MNGGIKMKDTEKYEDMDIEELKKRFEEKANMYLRKAEKLRREDPEKYREFARMFRAWYTHTVGGINLIDVLQGGKGDWKPKLMFWDKLPDEDEQ